MNALEFRNVHFAWNGGGAEAVEVLQGMSFSIEKRHLVCILGPSGCGKSTVMQLAAGLERPDSGDVLSQGQAVEGPSSDRGLICQKPKLFPWCTAIANVEWGLRMRGVGRAERRRIAKEMLANVGLFDWAHRRVQELSGGMQQRVAIARTLANDPDLMLMDEPYAGLDVQTRLLMQRFLLSTWAQTGKTIVMVTHDIDEALIADRVIVLSRRPARILEDLAVDLPRPREVHCPEFARLRARLSRLIEREVMADASETGGWEAAVDAPAVWKTNGLEGEEQHRETSSSESMQ